MSEGQPLVDHLNGVAMLAEEFAAGFGAAEAGRLLGLAHDLGKASSAFQTYLVRCHQGLPAEKSPHAAPGAAGAVQVLQWLTGIVL